MAFEDLTQEGYVALTVAVESYQAHVSKFSTFATKVIVSAMIRAIDDQGNLIRIPVHACEKLRKIQKQSEILRKNLGREATDLEIAHACNLPLQKVKELRAAAQVPVSLDTPHTFQGNTDSESLFEAQAPAYSTGASLDDTPERLRSLVQQRLGRLSREEREIVERIYGLGNFEASSEKEVALSLNRSEKKIRAIRDRALKIMAGPTESALGSMLGSEHEMLGIAA
jgi:RNA polymerase sigma factor (sigma-70 family)